MEGCGSSEWEVWQGDVLCKFFHKTSLLLSLVQGSSCQECQPFFVGSGINGGQCVPCEVFCHGNSQICMSESDRQIIGDFTDMSRVSRGLPPPTNGGHYVRTYI